MTERVGIEIYADTRDARREINRLSNSLNRLRQSSGRRSGGIGPININDLRRTTINIRQASRETRDFHRNASLLFNIWKAFFALQVAKRVLEVGASFLKSSESIQLMRARLDSMSESAAASEQAFSSLIGISKETGVEMEAAITVFQRLKFTQKEIDATNDEMLDFVSTIQRLGVIGGVEPRNLRAGLIQLGQGLSAGIVRAEEFNSIVENLPLAVKAIADEMNVTQGELRQLVIDGKLLSKDVFEAIKNQSEDIAETFEKFPKTFSRATNEAKIGFDQLTEAVDKTLGLTQLYVGALGKISGLMDDIRISMGFATAEEAAEAIEAIRIGASSTAGQIVKLKKELRTVGDELSSDESFDLNVKLKALEEDRLNDLNRQIELQQRIVELNKDAESVATLNKRVATRKFILKSLEREQKDLKRNGDLGVIFTTNDDRRLNALNSILSKQEEITTEQKIQNSEARRLFNAEQARLRLEKSSKIETDPIKGEQELAKLRLELTKEQAKEDFEAARRLVSEKIKTQQEEFDRLKEAGKINNKQRIELSNLLKEVEKLRIEEINQREKDQIESAREKRLKAIEDEKKARKRAAEQEMRDLLTMLEKRRRLIDEFEGLAGDAPEPPGMDRTATEILQEDLSTKLATESPMVQAFASEFELIEMQAKDSSLVIAEAFAGTIGGALSQLSDGIAEVIVNGGSLRDVFRSVAQTIATDLISGLIQIGVQRTVLGRLEALLTTQKAATDVAALGTITSAQVAALPAATALAIQNSIASYGGAAISGQGAYFQALGAMKLAGLTTAARAGGGSLEGGQVSRVNETGRPETFTTNDGRQYLIAPNGGGTVSQTSSQSEGAGTNFSQDIIINNESSSSVEVVRNDKEVIALTIKAVEDRFAQSMESGYGTFFNSMKRSTNIKQRI